MQACVIIPVWNGATTVGDCLRALLASADERLVEVVCVENASTDGSGALIAAAFHQVRLLPQPVNLGFAGGVNAGVAAAQAELIVLLNQDCLVQPGWLDGFSQVMQDQPDCGAVGCTVLTADGAVNHAGARITRPLAYGEHLTTAPAATPYPVEYATGAFLACRRRAWEQVGGMDEQFYPAYYEESDFCLRLQQQGWRVLVAPALRVTHLFTSREWQRDPVLHNAQQHRSRYRFVAKQFADAELLEFFAAELAASADETYFDQAIGRVLATRHWLRHLPELANVRAELWGSATALPFQRLADVHFGQVHRAALQRARRLAAPDSADPTAVFEQWRQALAVLRTDLAHLTAQASDGAARSQQIAAIEAARRLSQAMLELPAAGMSGLQRALHAVDQLRAYKALSLQQQMHLIAAHDATVARLDLLETHANQRMALLEQRLDLTEKQLTHLEYGRRVDELLALYEQF